MKRISVFLMVPLLLLLASCDAQPGKGTPDYTIQYDTISGVDPNLLSLDIYNSGITGPAPVVIWIHGGGWAIGDKLNSLEFKENLCKTHGYILVSINYRLSGGGVLHPTHAQDVAKAVAWVYNNINGYGGDNTRIAVMGHSAGGHLAALICTDETYLQAEGLDLNIISGCGSFDTDAYNIGYAMANGNEDNSIYLNAFTSNPSVWDNASPAFYVTPGKNIPSKFLFARRGGTVRQQICYAFSDSLNASGISTTIIDATSLTHEQVNDRIGANNDQIMTDAVISFLQSVF